jgi:copper homeostasis protein (lipoprotein)
MPLPSGGAAIPAPSCRSGRGFFPWLLILLAFCAEDVTAAATVQGTASYRERIALPADAVFEAELQDISRADAAAIVLGRYRQEPAGQPPFDFEIAYDAASVTPGSRYSVRATVKHQGRLLFTTDRIHPALDGRDTPLQLLMVSVDRHARAAASGSDAMAPMASAKDTDLGRLPASFQGRIPGAGNPVEWQVDLFPDGRYSLRTTHLGQPEPNRFDDIGLWTRGERGRIVLRGGREAPVFLMPVDDGSALRKLDLLGEPIQSGHNDRLQRLPEATPIEPELFLAGMFSHIADSPRITLCVDGRDLGVAMEGDYKALESAYLAARAEPGEPVLVNLEGRIAPRPSMEPGQQPRNVLVVKRFITLWPDQGCPTQTPGGAAATAR